MSQRAADAWMLAELLFLILMFCLSSDVFSGLHGGQRRTDWCHLQRREGWKERAQVTNLQKTANFPSLSRR